MPTATYDLLRMNYHLLSYYVEADLYENDVTSKVYVLLEYIVTCKSLSGWSTAHSSMEQLRLGSPS